ncbi:MAG: hypothetical protein FWB74_06195 [Defluviitaleaceae bacterium]|nr:hypothetical protein [Defluviitaleaceae bacterium]
MLPRPYFAMGTRRPRRVQKTTGSPRPKPPKTRRRGRRLLLMTLIIAISVFSAFTMLANRALMPAVITIAKEMLL